MDCGYSEGPPRSNEYPQSMFCTGNKRNITLFSSENNYITDVLLRCTFPYLPPTKPASFDWLRLLLTRTDAIHGQKSMKT